MGLARFSIATDGPVSRVVVNGDDVSDRLTGVQLTIAPKDVARLVLHHVPGSAEITGDGIVTVVEHHEGDGIDAATFLAAIDPGELDRAVLEGASLGTAGGAQAFLDVLVRWARGE